MAREFRKEKISRKALDDLARRYADPSSPTAFPYTLENGERIQVCGLKLLVGTGSLELKYLLGQTYPYHHLAGQEDAYFPVTDLIFDKDKKFWSKNPKDGTALLMLSTQSKTVAMWKVNGIPSVSYGGMIPPITYTEDGYISENALALLEAFPITADNFEYITKNFQDFSKIATKKQRLMHMEITDKIMGTSDAYRAIERLYIEQTSDD